MSKSHLPVKIVKFIDEEAIYYRPLFTDSRQYECFKWLLIGALSSLPRKSLPAIARLIGLKDGQRLNHFLRESNWSVIALRQLRLRFIRQWIGQRAITLCIDATGDVKKGFSTDYVAKQYIGNLGRTANGILSINAYAVVDNLTYPLLFKIYKPQSRLKPGDKYQTKAQLAIDLIREIHAMNFVVERVLTDSFYGEEKYTVELLGKELKLPYIVVLRSNQGHIRIPKHWVRYDLWKTYQQSLKNQSTQQHYIREIIFGERCEIRYFQIKNDSIENSDKTKFWSIMTNIPGDIIPILGIQYSGQNWLDYGFKSAKNGLGWHDYRLTDYAGIERWWELIFIAYLLVTVQEENFSHQYSKNDNLVN